MTSPAAHLVAQSAGQALTHPVILFDGHCLFCSGAVRWVHRRDVRFVFRFAAQQSPEGTALLDRLHVDTHGGSVVVIEGDRAWTGSDASLRIARELPAPWRWLTLFRVVPRFLRDAVYYFIARNRYRISGKSEACFLPDESMRRRFVLE